MTQSLVKLRNLCAEFAKKDRMGAIDRVVDATGQVYEACLRPKHGEIGRLFIDMSYDKKRGLHMRAVEKIGESEHVFDLGVKSFETCDGLRFVVKGKQASLKQIAKPVMDDAAEVSVNRPRSTVKHLSERPREKQSVRTVNDSDFITKKDYDKLWRFVLKRCGYHQQDAEDLFQTTLERGYRNRDNFEGRNNASKLTWLCQIAINARANAVRAKQPHNFVAQSSDPDGEGATLIELVADGVGPRQSPDWKSSCYGADPEKTHIALDLLHATQAELVRNPQKYDLFSEKYLEHKTYAQIQVENDLPSVGTAKSRVSRQRSELALVVGL